jgi:arsenite oxidase large subunit
MSKTDNPSPQLPIVSLPPKDAKVVTTVCDYCVVGCGYKAYVWPVGTEGGTKETENAYGTNFPTEELTGHWISPNMQSHCLVDGVRHHLVVAPDANANVVNPGGNHSIRGGCLALKAYDPKGPTKDRLTHPLIRIDGKLVPIDWPLAIDLLSELSQTIIAEYGPASWGMKTYSYQYFENTYAISKLAFESIKTPAYAPHDKPGPGSDTAGIDDAGIKTFSASYDDWAQADVLFISGSDPYESKTVLFTDWMMDPDKKIIMVSPRMTTGAAYAEKNGGLFLQILPGTDTILHLAISRIILEQGWEDKDFLRDWVANRWEIDSGFGRGTRNTPWQWRTTWGQLGASLEEYQKWLFEEPHSDLEKAAEMTRIPADKIRRAAEMIARPKNGQRPKTSFALEKGNYWSNNYLNTTSYAALAILCGAGNRPGRVVSRLGGHQRGWYGAASYPRIDSPEKGPGRRKKEIDLDRWLEAGKLRFLWVIGTTWFQAMAATQELADRVRQMTTQSPHQPQNLDRAHILDTWKKRAQSGGMVVVNQDIYLRKPIGSVIADLVLPAATWGEDDFTRCNGERRLRLYSKFCDPPGEAKPDWWIISQVAQKMGFQDYAWKNSNEVFEQAARAGRKSILNYHPLVEYAREAKLKAHELLRSLGTHGIQTPIRFRQQPTESQQYLDYAGHYSHPSVRGSIVGTKRLHDQETDFGNPEGPTVHQKWLTAFNTQSGKAVLTRSPWSLFSDFFERIRPQRDEFWITSGRINELWQSEFDDLRKAYIHRRWPEQWIEMHEQDAARLSLESGDQVRVSNDDVLIQTGGFIAVNKSDNLYANLEKNGHIRIGQGSFEGVLMVTDSVLPGVLWTNSLNVDSASNSVVHRVPDPITNRYRFKLGKGRVTKIGQSPFKKDLTRLTFASRTVI